MSTRTTWLAILLLAPAAPAGGQTTYYVATCGDDAWAGTSPVCAAPDGPKATILAAMTAAVDGDTVQVADGVYRGPGNRNLAFELKAITVRSENGPAACTIDCQGDGQAFRFVADEGPASVVEGFTITNGHAPVGGGLLIPHASSPTIRSCRIVGNSAAWAGGGIYFDAGSSPVIVDCLVADNAAELGGGVYYQTEGYSTAALRGCRIVGNTAGMHGGGVYAEGPSPYFVNCLIADNACAGEGGGVYSISADPLLVNCTIADNVAGAAGGGLLARGGGGGCCVPVIVNVVLWGNDAPLGPQIAAPTTPFVAPAELAVRFSDVEGGLAGVFVDPDTVLEWGPGNVDADPLFADTNAGDYRLGAGSPAIDAADNTAVPAGIETDLDGEPRFVDDPATPDTGVPDGANPPVDMGALELQPAGAGVLLVEQDRTVNGFVIVPQCLAEASDSESAPGFDPFDASVDVGSDCALASAQAAASQQSQIGPGGGAALGQATSSAEAGAPNTIHAIADSLFSVTFELLGPDVIHLAGELASSGSEAPIIPISGATIMLRDGDNQILFESSVMPGENGKAQTESFQTAIELEAGLYTLVADAASVIDNDVPPSRFGEVSYDLAFTFGAPPCPEDVTGDGLVNVDDLVAVILAWGTGDPAADVDASGLVDVDDLVAVILAWGDCAPPAAARA